MSIIDTSTTSTTIPVWETGDIITAEKLNSMGAEITYAKNKIVIVTITLESDYTTVVNCSHTYEEVRELYANGTPICLQVMIPSGTYEGMPINLFYIMDCDGQINTDGTPNNGPVFVYDGGQHMINFTSSGIQAS